MQRLRETQRNLNTGTAWPTDTSKTAYEIGATNKEELKDNECQALCCTAASIHECSICFYPAWLLILGLVDLNAAGKPEQFNKIVNWRQFQPKVTQIKS